MGWLRRLFILMAAGAVGLVLLVLSWLVWPAWWTAAPQVSTDLAGFQQKVQLPFVVAAVQWEVFGTPEYTGGVPGPTDLVTFMAVVQLPTRPHLPPASPEAFVAPGSARAWLPTAWQPLVRRMAARQQVGPDAAACGQFSARMRQSGRPITGVLCARGQEALVWWTLSLEP